ncbi:MAG: hypothetical protein ACP59X_18850 [Solidesulfovibrio sp. DCME]|uniref:hypothetical protein n=1 Tax=Solidesulfovibrio sp. DCME TaxID=3447380 RepID=UPI003D12FDC7
MAHANHGDGGPGRERGLAAATPQPGGKPLEGPGRPDAGEDAWQDDFAQMQALMAALPGMGAGRQGGPGCGPAGTTLATLEARLGLLEEAFGRLCNVVGRLEQEVAALTAGGAGHGR